MFSGISQVYKYYIPTTDCIIETFLKFVAINFENYIFVLLKQSPKTKIITIQIITLNNHINCLYYFAKIIIIPSTKYIFSYLSVKKKNSSYHCSTIKVYAYLFNLSST